MNGYIFDVTHFSFVLILMLHLMVKNDKIKRNLRVSIKFCLSKGRTAIKSDLQLKECVSEEKLC